MYKKSEEEVSEVLQILPQVYRDKYGEELSLRVIENHIINELQKHKLATIERQFAGWNTDSLLVMLKVLNNLSNPTPPQETKKKSKK